MKRRTFLAGCGCAPPLVVAGCIDDASDGDATGGESAPDDEEPDGATGQSNDDDDEDEEYESYYVLHINAPEESPNEGGSCEFEDLPAGAQTEFTNAIEEADFEAEEYVLYRLDDRPEMLDTDCYAQYIEFEDDYYEVNVISSGG